MSIRAAVSAKSLNSFAQSVISLNFANARGDNQIKARTFEVPGAGGFLLSEAAVGIEGIYSVDQEIAVFRDEQELAEKIRHFLSHPAERDAITALGASKDAVTGIGPIAPALNRQAVVFTLPGL